ncbi:MAG: Gfo/Idh/MocA family oxidoreductase [Bacteroidetes bacterium]|nr:Gfo/Idh/MocA family oxidoreductase [Fibrella sp.]
MNESSRRRFLRQLSGTSALLAGMPALANARDLREHFIEIIRPRTANDTINVALIGAGIIGHFDLNTALKVPGVKVVAACDLYDQRLTRAKEVWGADLMTTRDYREVLNRKDVDAVLICVPDHWHDHISIDALNAGKHVYCEKPMVHHIGEGQAVIAAHKKSGKVFQVGSQRASSAAVLEAKKRYQQGDIGDITYVEACTDRSDALGAWQYTMPPAIDLNQIDWARYQGDAPKHAFMPERFFRWRNYKDYGTGVAGDLFVHMLTGLHTITDSMGPTRIFALGDLNFWKDGRDAYDLVTSVLDYPKTDKHASFQMITRVNLSDGSGGSDRTRLVGTEGVIDIGGDGFTLRRIKRATAPVYSKGYDALYTYPQAVQDQFLAQYDAKYPADQYTHNSKREPDVVFTEPENYDDRLDHMIVFFNAIRENKPSLVREDAEFGLRAAAPSLAANLSVEQRRVINWDPVAMKLQKGI